MLVCQSPPVRGWPTEKRRHPSAIGPLGFEPRLTDSESVSIFKFPNENRFAQGSAAPDAAVEHEQGEYDADLEMIVEAWPTLSEETRASIARTVHEASEDA